MYMPHNLIELNEYKILIQQFYWKFFTNGIQNKIVQIKSLPLILSRIIIITMLFSMSKSVLSFKHSWDFKIERLPMYVIPPSQLRSKV